MQYVIRYYTRQYTFQWGNKKEKRIFIAFVFLFSFFSSSFFSRDTRYSIRNTKLSCQLNFKSGLFKNQNRTKLSSIFLTFCIPKSSPSCKNFTSDRPDSLSGTIRSCIFLCGGALVFSLCFVLYYIFLVFQVSPLLSFKSLKKSPVLSFN